MHFEQEGEPQRVVIEIEPPKADVRSEQFTSFCNALEQTNVMQMITERTGLRWHQPKMTIKQGEEAMWEGLDTIIVEYNRGVRAVSSLVHEALHCMLRQINWTEHPAVASLIKRHPELAKTKMGPGYSIEQMIAYLLQNEIYTAIAEQLHIDISNQRWGLDHFEMVLQNEYNTPFLTRLGQTIIAVWNNQESRPSDIFTFIEEVNKRLL